jgi:hypothetical protein
MNRFECRVRYVYRAGSTKRDALPKSVKKSADQVKAALAAFPEWLPSFLRDADAKIVVTPLSELSISVLVETNTTEQIVRAAVTRCASGLGLLAAVTLLSQ